MLSRNWKKKLFSTLPKLNNIFKTLMSELNDIDNSITSRQQNELFCIILYGDCKFK